MESKAAIQGLSLSVGNKIFRNSLGISFYSRALNRTLKMSRKGQWYYLNVTLLRVYWCVCEAGFKSKQCESLFKYSKCTILSNKCSLETSSQNKNTHLEANPK